MLEKLALFSKESQICNNDVMKTSLIALAVFVCLAGPAQAALGGGDPSAEGAETCRLDERRADLLDTIWNDLSRRYLLASLNAGEDPEAFKRVKREVSREVDRMRRNFGAACVLDIR